MLNLLAAVALFGGQAFEAGTGAPLPGVQISDGRTVVRTDAQGRFEGLPCFPPRQVFVIKPSGWKTVGNSWHQPTDTQQLIRFPLQRHPEPESFQALVFTDPQPANAREVAYFARSLTEPLAGAGAARRFEFGLTLGDVTYDRPDLYPSINAAMARMGLPWYPVNGNHDLQLGIAGEGAIAAYEEAYGPSTFAFHWGPALFIALNDVRHQGGPRYTAGLLSPQWEFLRALLAQTPPVTPLVLYFHIPLFRPDPFGPDVFPRAQRDRLFALLRPYRTLLLLSGHTHLQRRVAYTAEDGWQGEAPLREFNVAAACGGYWGGPVDAAGVPVSTMSDGTPPGYAVLSVSRHALSAVYRRRPDLGADDASEAQMALHVPRATSPRQGYVTYYANVFDADASWTVTGQVDDGGALPLRPVTTWDPSYAAAYLAQDAAAEPTRTPRLPDPTFCFHLWRAFLPADLGVGEHRLTVRATAPDGRTLAAVRTFRTANSRPPPPP